MPRKSKKKILNKNKNKNSNKIIVNVNSNNKKKVSKSSGPKYIPQSSGSSPIVITMPSFQPQPYLNHHPKAFEENEYGVGIHRALEGLNTRLSTINEENIQNNLLQKQELDHKLTLLNNVFSENTNLKKTIDSLENKLKTPPIPQFTPQSPQTPPSTFLPLIDPNVFNTETSNTLQQTQSVPQNTLTKKKVVETLKSNVKTKMGLPKRITGPVSDSSDTDNNSSGNLSTSVLTGTDSFGIGPLNVDLNTAFIQEDPTENHIGKDKPLDESINNSSIGTIEPIQNNQRSRRIKQPQTPEDFYDKDTYHKYNQLLMHVMGNPEAINKKIANKFKKPYEIKYRPYHDTPFKLQHIQPGDGRSVPISGKNINKLWEAINESDSDGPPPPPPIEKAVIKKVRNIGTPINT